MSHKESQSSKASSKGLQQATIVKIIFNESQGSTINHNSIEWTKMSQKEMKKLNKPTINHNKQQYVTANYNRWELSWTASTKTQGYIVNNNESQWVILFVSPCNTHGLFCGLFRLICFIVSGCCWLLLILVDCGSLWMIVAHCFSFQLIGAPRDLFWSILTYCG